MEGVVPGVGATFTKEHATRILFPTSAVEINNGYFQRLWGLDTELFHEES